ncbi:SsgA family sporulation/cell division regulator [Kitasatospora sp. NPDC094028]
MTHPEPTRVPSQRAGAAACAVPLALEVVGTGATVAVPALLRYDAADPYAVHLDIHTGESEPISWFFARELLRDGLHRPTGHGDVTVRPGAGEPSGRLFITLTGTRSAAVLRARSAEVEHFLAHVDVLVPPGTEDRYLDLDGLVGQLLGHPAG